MHKFTNTLTPAQVYRYAVECCQPHLTLRDAKRVTARMLLTILVAAAARISSLSDTCKRLRGVPDEEVVAAALYETLPDYNLLKRQVNAALAGHLPKPLRKLAQIVALDLTLLPFHGADAKENDQIDRSYLQAARMPFLMPVVGHGRKPDHPLGPSGSQVFKAMKRSGWFEYTLSDPRKRTATVQIRVKCRNRRGARGKKGREPWIYAYWGIGPKRFDWVKDTYRSRFGVETSYRQMNQCRIRTTTPRFAVRFLYVAIGFLMRNLWVWLHYAVLSSPHRGCRR